MATLGPIFDGIIFSCRTADARHKYLCIFIAVFNFNVITKCKLELSVNRSGTINLTLTLCSIKISSLSFYHASVGMIRVTNPSSINILIPDLVCMKVFENSDKSTIVPRLQALFLLYKPILYEEQ